MSLSPSLRGHICLHILSGEGQRPHRQRDAANRCAWGCRGAQHPSCTGTPVMNCMLRLRLHPGQCHCVGRCHHKGGWTNEQPSSLTFFDNQLSDDSQPPQVCCWQLAPPAWCPQHTAALARNPRPTARAAGCPTAESSVPMSQAPAFHHFTLERNC